MEYANGKIFGPFDFSTDGIWGVERAGTRIVAVVECRSIARLCHGVDQGDAGFDEGNLARIDF